MRKADRLVVLDRGQIVEIGSHDELMLREGAYYRLYQAQLRNADDTEGEPTLVDEESEENDENVA